MCKTIGNNENVNAAELFVTSSGFVCCFHFSVELASKCAALVDLFRTYITVRINDTLVSKSWYRIVNGKKIYAFQWSKIKWLMPYDYKLKIAECKNKIKTHSLPVLRFAKLKTPNATHVSREKTFHVNLQNEWVCNSSNSVRSNVYTNYINCIEFLPFCATVPNDSLAILFDKQCDNSFIIFKIWAAIKHCCFHYLKLLPILLITVRCFLFSLFATTLWVRIENWINKQIKFKIKGIFVFFTFIKISAFCFHSNRIETCWKKPTSHWAHKKMSCDFAVLCLCL